MDPELLDYYPPLCNPIYTGSIQPDPDIVGFGVLTSFLFSAWIVWIVQVLTWYHDALLEFFDDRLAWLQIALAQGYPIREGHRAQRAKAFAAVLTSLSDQQLVLGISILVAGLGRFRDINTYSINIVIDLAYLAANIYFASLMLSDPPSRKQTLVKALRIFLVLAISVLLTFLIVLRMSWAIWDHVQYLSLDCAFRHYADVGWDISDAFNAMTFIVVLINLLAASVAAFEVLWWGKSSNPSILVPRRLRKNYQGDARNLYSVVRRRETVRYNKMMIARPLAKHRHAEWYGFHCAHDSIELQIILFLFPLVYGTTSVLNDRTAFDSEAGLNSPGFGQIVPLVLLLLPALATMQSRYDYKDEIASHGIQSQTMTSGEQESHGSAHDDSDIISYHANSRMTRSASPSPAQAVTRTNTTLELGLLPDLATRNRTVSRTASGVLNGDLREDANENMPVIPPDSPRAHFTLRRARALGTSTGEDGDNIVLLKAHNTPLSPLVEKRVRAYTTYWLVINFVMAPVFGYLVASYSILYYLHILVFYIFVMVRRFGRFRDRYRYLEKFIVGRKRRHDRWLDWLWYLLR